MKLKFFNLCQKLAKLSDHHQHRIGAVVVQGNKILGKGYNSLKTHTFSPHPFKSCHAEYNAIKNIDKKALKGASIYIFRETRQNNIANSRPCPSCMALIQSSGIKQIFYTHEIGLQQERVG